MDSKQLLKPFLLLGGSDLGGAGSLLGPQGLVGQVSPVVLGLGHAVT